MLAVITTTPVEATPTSLTVLPDLEPRTPTTVRAEILYVNGMVSRAPNAAGENLFLTPQSGEDDRRHRIDPWLSFDKMQHATFSFFFTVGWQYGLENKLGWSRDDALPVSVGSTLVIGLGKELYDWQYGSRRFFSARDLVANGVGAGMAAVLILL